MSGVGPVSRGVSARDGAWGAAPAFGCDCTDASDAYVLHFTIDGDGDGNARDVALTPIVAGLSRPPARARDSGLRAQLVDLCRDLSGGVRIE